MSQSSPNSKMPLNMSDLNRLPDLATAIFCQIGEDPNLEGLRRTPERFAKAILELTQGCSLSGLDAIGEGIFEGESLWPKLTE